MDTWDMIEDYLPLEIRAPRGGGGKGGSSGSGKGGKGKGKGGSSSSSSGSASGSSSGSSSSSSSGGSSSKSGSSSSSGGTTVVVVGSGTSYHHGGGGYVGSLPTWAVVLIIWASLILTLFLCALLYYILKERKRSKQEGHSPRIKHALWKATKAALLIWLATKIWKSCCARSRRHKERGSTKAGTYAKIDEDGQHGASTTPAADSTAYGLGGKGSAPDSSAAESKYEPFSYDGGASRVHAAPPSGPDPAAAPSTPASPPPYSGTTDPTTTASTTTTATTGVNPYTTTPASTSTGGEAQSYYASMGMAGTYAPSISSAYEPSVLSTAPTPSPAYQAAYPPPAVVSPPTSPPPAMYPGYPAQATYVPHTSPGPRYGGT